MLAGLKYEHKIWAEAWPRIIDNTIEACKQARARLIFFDNVYMYGRVRGPMTEETPYRLTSKKGEIRTATASTVERTWTAGSLTAMIARCADFYGPGAKNGIPNTMVFDPMSHGKTPMCLASDVLPHSYTYVPDAARALVTLAESESAWNQVWHLPTAPHPLTGREFITAAAEAMSRPVKYRIPSRPMVKMVGWFNPLVREVYEMLYQNDSHTSSTRRSTPGPSASPEHPTPKASKPPPRPTRERLGAKRSWPHRRCREAPVNPTPGGPEPFANNFHRL